LAMVVKEEDDGIIDFSGGFESIEECAELRHQAKGCWQYYR
jgi:hypothetical protein